MKYRNFARTTQRRHFKKFNAIWDILRQFQGPSLRMSLEEQQWHQFFVPYQPSRHRKNMDQPIGSMSYLNQEKTLLRGRQQKAFMHFFVSFNDSNWVSSDFNAILIMSVWRLTNTLFQDMNSFETTLHTSNLH